MWRKPDNKLPCKDCGVLWSPEKFYTSPGSQKTRCKKCWGKMSSDYEKTRHGGRPCKTCGLEFNSTDFYTSPKSQKQYCKKCWGVYHRAWSAKKKVSDPDYDKVKARRHRWKSIGVTEEQYAKLISECDGVCSICGSKEGAEDGRILCVDHCHESGNVRGILCRSCNLMIANAKDSPDILEKAAAYLVTRGAHTFVEL